MEHNKHRWRLLMTAVAGSRRSAEALRAQSRNQSRMPSLLSAAIAVAGLGMGFLVARDGSPAWQIGRTVAVVSLASAALYAVRRGSARLRGLTAFVVGVVATAA